MGGDKFKYLFNNFLISVAFLLQFTAYNGIGNLQSSINCVDGLGTYTVATIYAALIVSCLFVPTIAIQKLGLKWSLAFSFTGYIVYTAANFYPEFYTLIPAAIYLGFCAAPLWSSQCQYLTVSAEKLSKVAGKTTESWVNRMFGTFFFVFQLNQLFGNLISSLILNGGFPSKNNTMTPDDEVVAIQDKCGLNFQSSAGGCEEIGGDYSDATIYTLMGIYVGTGCIALCIIVFAVNPLEIISVPAKENTSTLELAKTTINHTIRSKHGFQALLIPLTIYSGLEQSFLIESFTAAWVSCAFDPGWVGLVMIAYGVTNALFSFVSGVLEQCLGRKLIFAFGAVLNLSLIIVLLGGFLLPDPNNVLYLFLFAIGWGICDAVWQCALNALYGVLFKEDQEAAFANYRLWESLGFCAAFAYGNALNSYVKLIICLVFLILGMAGYSAVEVINARHPVKTVKKETSSDEEIVEDGVENKAFGNDNTDF
ncbi:unnamed protein product [Oikopleura dioica]|uniref:Protein unc-93 homolog A n=1 Tax=Oikopleura dioica TaxID=34765 RepID=E4Y222_OIKDI|nr:unnamed protein product [Oikopleura dioica]